MNDVLNVLTLLIALWGAVLATYLAIRDRKKERRTLKLSFMPSIGNRERSQFGAFLVTNTGYRPVTIRFAAIEEYQGKNNERLGKKQAPLSIYEPECEQGKLPLKLEEAAVAVFQVRKPRNLMGTWFTFQIRDISGNKYLLEANPHYEHALIDIS